MSVRDPLKFYKEEEKRKEEWGIVLDVFEAEKSAFHRRLKGRIAQLVGDRYFTLLEGLVKNNVELDELERVYIGPGPRDKISAILRRIKLDDLTSIAKASIEKAIEKAVKENETRWTEFFNEAGPLTKKLHSLELLPGIGKKKMWKIIQERERRKFTNFEDINKRVGIDPVKVITKRIIDELRGSEKYKVFVPLYETRRPHY
ncbi:DUF655 domain-containing protein [Candidatus Geothermarchaeota archaeon]|nr:MAG: DUF655 domain-containing protein [Candidatus Geothermarchaeota archaeon]